MKISQEVRDYADDLDLSVEDAKQQGMDEMSEVFKEHGSEVYVEVKK